MLRYIIKRSAYSILVIIGVVIVTFLLFRIAAGDPVYVLLGKKPAPEEVEELRMQLGADKPLFWGYWRRTEAFTSVDFGTKATLPGITVSGDYIRRSGRLCLNKGDIVFTRNFPLDGVPIRAEIRFRGNLLLGSGSRCRASTWRKIEVSLSTAQPEFRLAAGKGGVELTAVRFFRKQADPWNSQFAGAITEIVRFQPRAPYLSFFNFGRTLITREDIRKVLWRGLWPSLGVMVPVFIGELVLGILLALAAAACKDSWLDRTIVVLAVAGMSVSYLVFIIFGQWYLGYYYNWFPVWGYGDVRHLLLPIIIGVVSGLGGGVRFYRTIFINELNRDYLRTARAKGCGTMRIYLKHLLANAAIPIIARATSMLPFLFTGSLLLETFFGIPGLGYAGINALMNSDLQMVKALVIVGAMIFVVVNLLADLAYAWADPRVRLA